MTFADTWGVTLSSVLGIITMSLVYRKRLQRLQQNKEHARFTVQFKKLNSAFIRALGAVLWPPLLLSMICREDISSSVVLVPLVVHTVIWFLDALLMFGAQPKDVNTVPSLRIDPSSLTGMGLAMSSLVGNRPNSKYTHFFLYSIIACFLVVLPSHNLEPESLHSQLFENVQKSVLFWCICSIVAAVALTRYQLFCGESINQNEGS